MTDIPEMYLAEAVRRLNVEYVNKYGRGSWNRVSDADHPTATSLARTLQELGWTPPIDEARMDKARKVFAAGLRGINQPAAARTAETQRNHPGVQAAYDALGEA